MTANPYTDLFDDPERVDLAAGGCGVLRCRVGGGEPHMNYEDETPKAVYPEGYRPPSVADGTVSPGLVDAVRDLFDRYGPAGAESTVIEMRRQKLVDAVEVAALTVVLGDAPANTELVTTAGAEALARYLYARGVQVRRS